MNMLPALAVPLIFRGILSLFWVKRIPKVFHTLGIFCGAVLRKRLPFGGEALGGV